MASSRDLQPQIHAVVVVVVVAVVAAAVHSYLTRPHVLVSEPDPRV